MSARSGWSPRCGRTTLQTGRPSAPWPPSWVSAARRRCASGCARPVAQMLATGGIDRGGAGPGREAITVREACHIPDVGQDPRSTGRADAMNVHQVRAQRLDRGLELASPVCSSALPFQCMFRRGIVRNGGRKGSEQERASGLPVRGSACVDRCDERDFAPVASVPGVGRAADGTRAAQGGPGFRRGCSRPPWPGQDDPAVGTRQPGPS